MVKRVTQIDLQRAAARGAEVTKIPQLVEIPELEKLLTEMMGQEVRIRDEKNRRWGENHQEKMAKFDELIAAIKSATPATLDLAPIMAMVREIQRDHKKIAAEHAALMAGGEEREPCTYKLTGRRDQRGLIDLEYGLTFTPVDD